MRGWRRIWINGQNTERGCTLENVIFNERSGTEIAVALTSQPQRAGFPLTFELDHPKPPKKSWVKISQVRTLSVERLTGRILTLPSGDVDSIVDGLREILSD
jgi:mRNA interferase MazF